MIEYPKKITLREGSTVSLRTVSETDFDLLLHMFRTLPDEDRIFLRNDVSKPGVLQERLDEIAKSGDFHIVAECDGRIVAEGLLEREHGGWSKHIAEIRMVVAPEYQKRGLGTRMARELLQEAVARGVEILEAKMMEQQVGAIQAFRRLGFKKEAVFRNYVKDVTGKRHDLVYMVSEVEELWRRMDDMIADQELRFLG